MNLEKLELEQNQITKRVKEMGHGVGLPNKPCGHMCATELIEASVSASLVLTP